MENKQALVTSKVNTSEVDPKRPHGQKNQRGPPGSCQCPCIKKLRKSYSIKIHISQGKGSEAKTEKRTLLNSCERFVPITPLPGPAAASLSSAGSAPGATHVQPTYMQHAHLESSSSRDGRFLNDMKGLVKMPQKLPTRRYQELKAVEVVHVNDESTSNGDAEHKSVLDVDVKSTHVKRDFDLNKVPTD